MLREKLSEATKDAMKSGEKLKLSTLRMVQAAIKNADIEARTGKGPLDDDAILSLMQKLIKQRQDSVELYEKGGRAELAQQEKDEIEVIKGFLPAQMSDAEMKAAIADIIAKEGASGMKDMGKVMNALKTAYAGKMDFGKASGAVKSLLAG
ncbi:MAG TPA: GatB/YqeY domain-containing protein [Xanthobacteraceae bacterium]|nr:GatB/YqeY domain-containing protein [Xanthobacteraceae bacterium]